MERSKRTLCLAEEDIYFPHIILQGPACSLTTYSVLGREQKQEVPSDASIKYLQCSKGEQCSEDPARVLSEESGISKVSTFYNMIVNMWKKKAYVQEMIRNKRCVIVENNCISDFSFLVI